MLNSVYEAARPRSTAAQIAALLGPARIGVTLDEEVQLHPGQSTDDIVIHHPEAKYFIAR
ncbi:hypothetical protein SMICM304S_06812 [Streptomyces microflavus]